MSKDDFDLLHRAYSQIMYLHNDCLEEKPCTCLVIAGQVFNRLKELNYV